MVDWSLGVVRAMTTVGPKPWLIITAIALTAAPRVARVTRGAAVEVADGGYVQVSEALGESTWHIVRTDLVPNISGPLLVEASIRFTYSIGVVASLAFLGFNADVNGADWGVMVQENRTAFGVQPWGVLLPVLAIAALAFGGGLLADGWPGRARGSLSDDEPPAALNPALRIGAQITAVSGRCWTTWLGVAPCHPEPNHDGPDFPS